jgi:hypothetical protein
MEVRIEPEPSPEEREAILRALARVHADERRDASAWWREGLALDVSRALDEPPDATP